MSPTIQPPGAVALPPGTAHPKSVGWAKPRPVPADAESIALIRHALKVCPLMNSWPDHVIDQLAASARLGRYGKEVPLTQQVQSGREAIVVVAGRLLVEGVNAVGARFVLALHGPGEILGLVRMLEHTCFLYHFQVAENTVLVHLPAPALMAVLDAHPILWRDVSMLVISRLHDLIARQQRRAVGHVCHQVADMLVRLAATIGKPGEGGQISLSLSQKDLAAMLALSRQTVSKELHRLQKDGVIDAAYGRIHIFDLQVLRQRAG